MLPNTVTHSDQTRVSITFHRHQGPWVPVASEWIFAFADSLYLRLSVRRLFCKRDKRSIIVSRCVLCLVGTSTDQVGCPEHQVKQERKIQNLTELEVVLILVMRVDFILDFFSFLHYIASTLGIIYVGFRAAK